MSKLFPRAFLGYGVSETQTLLAEINQEVEQQHLTREERIISLEANLNQMQSAVQELERKIEEGLREQAFLFASLNAVTEYGQTLISREQEKLSAREARVMAEFTQREALLGSRQQLLEKLHETVEHVLKETLIQLEPEKSRSHDQAGSETGFKVLSPVAEPHENKVSEL